MGTKAEQIAEALADGQQWLWMPDALDGIVKLRTSPAWPTSDDESGALQLEDVLRACGGKLDWMQRDQFGDVSVFEFNDGSAIAMVGNAWDARADGCEWHCWDGHGCDCCE